MLEFAWPWAAAAIVLPLLSARLLPRYKGMDTSALRVLFFHALQIDAEKSLAKKRNWRLLIAAFAWCCLVLAACRPQWIAAPTMLPISGRDLMLAIDLSGSMDEVDMTTDGGRRSRLHIVKRVAGEFIAKRIGDRIGLILFGSRAHVYVPMTFDRQTVLRLLRETNTGLAGSRTAMGDAIALAIKHLRQIPAQSRVLILLSDGASNSGIKTEEALQWAQQAKIKIYTIGVGTSELAQNLANDPHEKTLQTIADLTGGRYFRARNEEELGVIYQLIDQLEPMPSQETEFKLRKELFFWPLIAAFTVILCYLLAQLLPDKEQWRAKAEQG